jgi:hypothetical protein
MTFPKQTPEYLAAKEALSKVYAEARAPHWKRYCAGEITHSEYCELIDEAYVAYSNDLEPHWVKAGGSKNPKAKPMKVLQAEYSEKWRRTAEDERIDNERNAKGKVV